MDRVSLIDQIVEEIKTKILNGELRDGDMLQSQDEMAKAMEVSRTSLREALRRLELMGLIESKHGRGTFVKTVHPENFMNPLMGFLPIDRDTAVELLEARLYLEGSATALAAQKATHDDIQAMKDALEGMKRAAADYDVRTFIDLDVRFHLLVAEGTRNRIMIQVVNILRSLLHQLVSRVLDTNRDQLEQTLAQTIEYHQSIFEAIRERDASKARDAMESHIKDVKKKLERDVGFDRLDGTLASRVR